MLESAVWFVNENLNMLCVDLAGELWLVEILHAIKSQRGGDFIISNGRLLPRVMVIASKGWSVRSGGIGIYDQYIEALLDEHTFILCDSSSMSWMKDENVSRQWAQNPNFILRVCWDIFHLRFSNCSECLVKKSRLARASFYRGLLFAAFWLT